MDISNEAVLERVTLQATDPLSGNYYHLLYQPPMTQEIKDRLVVNPKHSEETVLANLAAYHAYREELAEYYSRHGAQRVNADQDTHTIFETLEGQIVNPLPTCSID